MSEVFTRMQQLQRIASSRSDLAKILTNEGYPVVHLSEAQSNWFSSLFGIPDVTMSLTYWMAQNDIGPNDWAILSWDCFVFGSHEDAIKFKLNMP